MSLIPTPRDTKEFGREWISFFNAITLRLSKVTTDTLLKAPKYNNSNRPVNLTNNDSGVIIYNSDDANLNIWNGSAWILPDGSLS